MYAGPYSEPAESTPYPNILPAGKNVHGMSPNVSSLCIKSSLVDLFICIFKGSPESEDCYVIKKENE
jgi:hypothetical protein